MNKERKNKNTVPGLFLEGFKNNTFGSGIFIGPLCKPHVLFNRKNQQQNIYILPYSTFKYNGCIEVTPWNDVSMVFLEGTFAGRTIKKVEGDVEWDKDMEELKKEVSRLIQKYREKDSETWANLDTIWKVLRSEQTEKTHGKH